MSTEFSNVQLLEIKQNDSVETPKNFVYSGSAEHNNSGDLSPLEEKTG